MGPDHLPLVGIEVAAPAAAMLGAARALGILLIFPIFSLFSIVGILRFGLAIGLSAPSVAFAYSVLAIGDTSWFDLAALSMKELCFGALVGMGLGIPFWAAQAAGDMTDVYRGANAANLFDQINALETAPLGSLMMSIALVIFVSAGGIIDLVAIFYKSFELWPLFKLMPAMPEDPLDMILGVFGRLFKAAGLLAAPFMIVTCALELSLAFVGRSSKQFPLNDSLPAIKNFAVVVILVIYTAFISSYFHDLWIDGFNEVKAMLEVTHGQK
ncbi:UNVERIFIED_ORG: type III secretion protein T [Rhizobium aethiopicum]|uniref:EscT/YscT/HrcT family type III secretion system export apparatus protein n=1 Tax=unclassified Rhizobium TaxID=2613769 RepID=UPI0007EBF374|nr:MULTISPECIES: flagellar biosynthetic protein FliR [unclassified Rhizobium]ANM13602.1 type III secretion system inner membrane protein [Rhizobium sp. N324]ANM19983.1 type III secretion system inner membrane protein [Rhizobium sp. N541]ANM26368.1 type III secretion system inner membrane protein [Rhizobium sp. N941]OYD00635.1 type III secretion system inner membrane protein [Rhizobium sp. N4311]